MGTVGTMGTWETVETMGTAGRQGRHRPHSPIERLNSMKTTYPPVVIEFPRHEEWEDSGEGPDQEE